MEEVVLKSRAEETQIRDNPEGGELDPAEGVHRRCRKNSPSAPTSRHLIVVVWPPPLLRVVGRNGENTFPRSRPTGRPQMFRNLNIGHYVVLLHIEMHASFTAFP